MHHEARTAPQTLGQFLVGHLPHSKPCPHELFEPALEDLRIPQLLCNDTHARSPPLLHASVVPLGPKTARVGAGLHQRLDQRLVVDAVASDDEVRNDEVARGDVEFPVKRPEDEAAVGTTAATATPGAGRRRGTRGDRPALVAGGGGGGGGGETRACAGGGGAGGDDVVVLRDVLLDEARNVRLVREHVTGDEGRGGEAYEGGDAAAQLEDGRGRAEGTGPEEEVGGGGGEPGGEEGGDFPDD